MAVGPRGPFGERLAAWVSAAISARFCSGVRPDAMCTLMRGIRRPPGSPGVDELMPVGGGTPIVHAGGVVGAVGVSGATEEQDQEIADAAVAALGV